MDHLLSKEKDAGNSCKKDASYLFSFERLKVSQKLIFEN